MRYFGKFLFILAFTLFISCQGYQESSNSKSELTKDGLRQFNDFVKKTDKSKENDVWYGSIYRNKKYHFRIEFPKNWELDSGMSINTIARAIDREHGISLSVAIQHLPVDVPDTLDIFQSITFDEFKYSFARALEETNKTILDDLEVKRSILNNLPAYLMSATYNASSIDRTVKFLLLQICCLKESKYYIVQMVLPVDFYNEKSEQIFRSFVDSFKFEFY